MIDMLTGYKVADLFCGAGGLSLGFEKAGYHVDVAIDNWPQALEVHAANFHHDCLNRDLSGVQDITGLLRQRGVSGIIGGPPCQDFSHAGKRKEGKRADLTACFAEIVKNVEPFFFVMENVARTQSSQAYQTAKGVFEGAGYGLSEVVLDASLCGVPQKRKRFFCIGVLNQTEGFLLGTIRTALNKTPMTMRQYFAEALGTEYYYRHPRNYSRRAVYSLDEPSAVIRGVNRPIPPNYPGHAADAAEISLARPLTTSERAQVQTFPEDFRWIGNKTTVEQMIGNAVPVNLALFVARCLYTFLQKMKTPILRH